MIVSCGGRGQVHKRRAGGRGRPPVADSRDAIYVEEGGGQTQWQEVDSVPSALHSSA